MIIDTLEVDLSMLECAFKHGLNPVLCHSNSPILEISISPEFQAAIITDKHRFISHSIEPCDASFAGGTVASDLSGIFCHKKSFKV